MAFIRRRLRFSILRTTLIALRGSRTGRRKFCDDISTRIVDIDLNLVGDYSRWG